MILAWVNGIYEGIASFLTGMRTTGSFLVENLRGEGGATAMTRQYPAQPAEVIGERGRGHLVNDAERCIVCHACDKVCPVDCFVMDGERNEDNKLHTSRFDIDLSKCIYCGLCVRACPTDSLSMTPDFEVDPVRGGFGRYLFRRNSAQLDQRLDTADVQRLTRLANLPREQLSDEERAWLEARVDPQGQHLIGMFGQGYYTPAEKAVVDAEREAKKKAKEATAAAKAKTTLRNTPAPLVRQQHAAPPHRGSAGDADDRAATARGLPR